MTETMMGELSEAEIKLETKEEEVTRLTEELKNLTLQISNAKQNSQDLQKAIT